MSIFSFGNAYVLTKNIIPESAIPGLNDRLFFPFEGTSIAFTQQANKVEAKVMTPEGLQTKRSGISAVQRGLKLSGEFANWAHMGFFQDELPSSSADVPIPAMRTQMVPLVTPFVIRDPAIKADLNTRIYVMDRGAWGEAGPLKKTGVAAGSAAVATGTLTFSAAYAGAPIAYTIPTSFAAIESIGLNPMATKYGALELWFQAFGDADYPQGLWLHFPQITRDGMPSLDFGQVPMKFEVTFSVNNIPGRNKPFEIYNPATAPLPVAAPS